MPSSGLRDNATALLFLVSSDLVVAAVELLFLILATLDVTVALLGFIFGWLGLVILLRATNKMATKPSPITPFSEGFFLVLTGLGIMSQGESGMVQ